MTDAKRKPGRPRKWSSDAERMGAARAAERAKRLADEERREVQRAERERASREKFASSPNFEPVPAPGAPTTGNTWMAVHATCETNIVKLRGELRELEDEYDDSVYDRWILEHQYRMAVTRMQEHDPDGIAWLDEQVRRWESRREGYLEDRRRLRLGGRKVWHLGK
ncbi:MAG TPA: hypothetical protein VES40_12830 [Ilumatobacteraceae bacterium]|nr:hypothetical protein [Ilumatobacteraceae bacterium]